MSSLMACAASANDCVMVQAQWYSWAEPHEDESPEDEEETQERENWKEIIRDTADEEEHSLHPCNPIDLEKRLHQ